MRCAQGVTPFDDAGVGPLSTPAHQTPPAWRVVDAPEGWLRRPCAAGGRQLDTQTAPQRNNVPNKNHAGPIRYKTRPARVTQTHSRYKTRPAHPFSQHARYKTRPAHPFSPHARYKTRPARPKRPNLACFARAWRTFYRFHRQQAVQGELSTVFATNKPSRANFLPFSPPTSQAGRTLYRIQAGCGASTHNSTPGHTGMKVSRGSNE